MEITEGKTVEGEHVTIFLRQPLLKILERRRLAQLARGHFTEPQSNGVRLPRRHSVAHRQRVSLQRLKRLGPIFSAMDVGAVGEMESVV
jgi:hypothetical protein